MQLESKHINITKKRQWNLYYSIQGYLINYWQTFSRRAISSGLPLNSAVEVFKAVGLSGFDRSSGGTSFPSFNRFT